MSEYRILKTKEAPNVDGVYWDIEYKGRTYSVHTYYSGGTRQSVFVKPLGGGPEIDVWRELILRMTQRGFPIFANTLEKRIRWGLERCHQEVEKRRNTVPEIEAISKQAIE